MSERIRTIHSTRQYRRRNEAFLELHKQQELVDCARKLLNTGMRLPDLKAAYPKLEAELRDRERKYAEAVENYNAYVNSHVAGEDVV